MINAQPHLAVVRRRTDWLLAAHYWLASAANARLRNNKTEWSRCWDNVVRCHRSYRSEVA